jgi:hypothetical protein
MLSLVFLCWLLIELMLITVLMQEVDGLVNAADDKYQLTHRMVQVKLSPAWRLPYFLLSGQESRGFTLIQLTFLAGAITL